MMKTIIVLLLLCFASVVVGAVVEKSKIIDERLLRGVPPTMLIDGIKARFSGDTERPIFCVLDSWNCRAEEAYWYQLGGDMCYWNPPPTVTSVVREPVIECTWEGCQFHVHASIDDLMLPGGARECWPVMETWCDYLDGLACTPPDQIFSGQVFPGGNGFVAGIVQCTCPYYASRVGMWKIWLTDPQTYGHCDCFYGCEQPLAWGYFACIHCGGF